MNQQAHEIVSFSHCDHNSSRKSVSLINGVSSSGWPVADNRITCWLIGVALFAIS